MAPRWLLLATITLGCTKPAVRPEPNMDPGRLPGGLEEQFLRSAQAWNRGDLDAFMAGYAPDSEPTFIADGHLQRGFDFIRGRYAPLFAPGARRDSLRLEEFQIRPITDAYAIVTARYILYRNGSTTASGPFTVLMHRRQEGWKILHDHSSSD